MTRCEDPLTLTLSSILGKRELRLLPFPLGEGWDEELPGDGYSKTLCNAHQAYHYLT